MHTHIYIKEVYLLYHIQGQNRRSNENPEYFIVIHYSDSMRLLFWNILLVMAVCSDSILANRAKRFVAFKKGSTFFVSIAE